MYSRTLGALALSLSLLAGGLASAQQQAQSIRPLLKLVSLTGIFLKLCDIPAGAVDMSAADALIARRFDQLQEPLTARAIALGVPPAEARKEIASYLESLQRDVENPAQFIRICPADINRNIEALRAPSFEAAMRAYADAPVHYDQPFQMPDSAETYAGPSTQQRLLLAIQSSMGNCDGVQIIKTEQIGRKVQPAERLPVFVKPVISYKERWTAECNGQTKTFVVQHSRSSEGPVGLYSVK